MISSSGDRTTDNSAETLQQSHKFTVFTGDKT